MTRKSNAVSRRKVLKATGAATATLGTTGLAAATDGTVEVNVGFSAESGRKAALDAAEEVVREFDFDALTVRAAKEAVTGLRERADVRYVEQNGTMHALAETLPWGVDRIDAEVAHANGDTGYGGDIAILDTGIDTDHPDLDGNLGAGYAPVPCDDSCSGCGLCATSWDDDNGHGTNIAGVIGAEDDSEGVVGVAPDATLHAVKVLDCNGAGTYSDIAAGLEYTADQGWDVANMSLGGSSGSSTLKDAVQYAYNNGVLMFAAAGGDGPCSDCVGYPAAYQEVIAVSATNRYDNLASFSSTGPEIELAAPGQDVYTTACDGGYSTLSGTSFACAHAAGAGGQVMANGYSHTDARQRLRDTAEDIGLSSYEQGYGLVDVAAALGHYSGDN